MLKHSLVYLATAFAAAFILLALPSPEVAVAADAPFAGIELRIPNETVPPGGMLQLKVEITEPKPILKGGQRNKFKAKFLGQVQGVELFSPNTTASGTAVLAKGAAQFSLNSPLTNTDPIDYPILTIAIPVKTFANRGDQAKLSFDPNGAHWLDQNGQEYQVLTTDGLVTVGGSLSINNIVPGGGVVLAGTKIAIEGVGFQPDSKVQVNNAVIATSTYISPNEIDITLGSDTNMTSQRVRVTNPSNNERVEYYSYQRTKPIGQSTNPLIAATAPLFSQTFWPVAYLKPVLTNTQFTGIAMQNQTSSEARARLRLSASDGTVLATRNVRLPANRRITRDLAELLGVAADTGTTLRVKVTSGPPIQILGLLADSASGTVDPMEPSPAP